MKIPQHRINWAESRWYKVDNMTKMKFWCEHPERCNKTASSIHHIKSSYRGKRDDSPENLIALCIYHHEYIHNHNNYDNRQMLLDHTKQYENKNADINTDRKEEI